MLRIRSIKKSFGSFSLYIENLEIRNPGIYGLIGHNGCGKSTAAKIIGGILQPDSGEINTSLESGDITMITQKPYIMNDTVYNNLEYPLRLRKIENRKSLCEEYLGKAGLLERRNQMARGLSGGEKQKLALLRAMIFKPRMIILDEAMSELDFDSLDLFEGMIFERQKQDPIIWIIISHQLAQIRKLCGYIFFMSNGTIEEEGPVDGFLCSANPAIARFLEREIPEM